MWLFGKAEACTLALFVLFISNSCSIYSNTGNLPSITAMQDFAISKASLNSFLKFIPKEVMSLSFSNYFVTIPACAFYAILCLQCNKWTFSNAQPTILCVCQLNRPRKMLLYHTSKMFGSKAYFKICRNILEQ